MILQLEELDLEIAMGDLMIRLKDSSLVDALTEMARAHHRTLESEVQQLLARAVEERARRLELVRRAEEIAAMTPKGVKQTDSTLLVREDRDR